MNGRGTPTESCHPATGCDAGKPELFLSDRAEPSVDCDATLPKTMTMRDLSAGEKWMDVVVWLAPIPALVGGLMVECARQPTALSVVATALLAVVGTATELVIWLKVRARWARGVAVEPEPTGPRTGRERLQAAGAILLLLLAVSVKAAGLDGTTRDKVISVSIIAALILTAVAVETFQRRRR